MNVSFIKPLNIREIGPEHRNYLQQQILLDFRVERCKYTSSSSLSEGTTCRWRRASTRTLLCDLLGQIPLSWLIFKNGLDYSVCWWAGAFTDHIKRSQVLDCNTSPTTPRIPFKEPKKTTG